MAILDKENKFSDGQAVTASAYSDDVIDKSKPGMLGKDMIVVVQTKGVDWTAGGAATLEVEFRTSDGLSGGDLDGNAVVLWKSKVLALADLKKNQRLVRIKTTPDLRRFLQLFYTVTTGQFTAGSLDAQLQKDVEVLHDETQ